MDKIVKEDFEVLDKCPWCSERNDKFLYRDSIGSEIMKCNVCGIVYSKKRLNCNGLRKYWKDYLTRVHIADIKSVKEREIMYRLDFDFINQFVASNKKRIVLDMGCGNASFLDIFSQQGYDCIGVEYGLAAAHEAKKKYKVYQGEFPSINIQEKVDLVIFRGVLQYLHNPKDYLQKGYEILKNNGYMFITAQPNVESFCFNLFKEKFTQPVGYADFFGYSEAILTKYLKGLEMKKVAEKYFYEETPYANVESDILKVAEAIMLKRRNMDITVKSPAFFGNMLSLVYKKG